MTTAEITNQDILEALNAFAVQTELRFEALEHRFDRLEHRFDQMDLRLGFVENQNHAIIRELGEVKQRVDHIDGHLMGVENDIKEIYSYLPVPGGE